MSYIKKSQPVELLLGDWIKKKLRCQLTPNIVMFHQIIRLREETDKMLEEQRQKEAQRVQRIWQQAGT